IKKSRIILLLAAVVLIGGGVYLYNIFYGANNFADAEKKSFFVSKGESWEETVDSLAAQGIVRDKDWFNLVTNVYSRGKQTHVGKYEFKSGISNAELYNNLRLGRGIVSISVTLKEGRTAVTFSRAFARTLGIDTVRFMNLVNDETYARSLGVEAKNLEGYLSPNTYSFNWQTDESEIIRRLTHQTEKVFDDSLRQRAQELNMSLHEVLTLASIIEGEASLDDERAIISGVYHNRLRKGMKLEADPTIQFIIADGPRRIVLSDLRINNPYNTYMYYGLPPGPISNPQAASIIAALYPAKHNYLFFVANGRGGHWFSSNYADHMNNVRKFRRERAAQGRNQDLS
ncbi:MAG: endolytic transglycosylase MltG, partial [Bacteroidota bacterium]